jgi:DNA replication protein DnaC
MARLRTMEEYYREREQEQPFDVRVRLAGIPVEHQHQTWDDYDGDADVDDEKLKSILMHYGKSWDMSDRMSLVLLGDPGVGKSMGLALLAKDLIAKGCWVRWVSFEQLMQKRIEIFQLQQEAEQQGDWGEHEKAEMKFRWITEDCHALFLDDLGKEHRTETRFSDNQLDHILRSRHTSGRLTFLSSNMTSEEFSMYSPSMVSFLAQMSEVCDVTDAVDKRDFIVPPKRAARRARR